MRAAFAVAVAIFCAGCDSGIADSSSQQSAVLSAQSSETTARETTSQEPTQRDTNPQELPDEQTAQSAESAQTDETAQSIESGTGESAETEQPAQTAQTAQEQSEQPSVPEQPREESVPAGEFIEQTQTAQAQPPAQVVLPTVVSPSAPKTAAFVAENGFIDYSNAAQGYIAVSYTGGSDRAKLRMVCDGVTYDHDVTIGGVDYFPLSCGSGSYTLQLFEHAEGKMYALVLDETVELSVESTLSAFLKANHYVWYEQDSACVEKSAQLCAGAQNEVEKLAAIFLWLTENVSYDRELAATVKSGYCPNPDKTLSLKKGICFDYASLFAAMTRAQGIPTRLVVGYAADNIYHAWNEVYTAETGWITPQLLLKNKGYNIVDATFYASAADKGAISEYISNEGNYAAIYYY